MFFRSFKKMFVLSLILVMIAMPVSSMALETDGSWAKEVRITSKGGLTQNPSISPDGQWIYFQSTAETPWAVMRMRPDGSEVTNLTGGVPENNGGDCAGTVNGNGTKIVYTCNVTGIANTMVANADGSNPQLVGGSTESYIYMGNLNYEGTEVTYANNSEGYKAYVMNLETEELTCLTPDMINCIGMQFTPDGQKVVFSQKYNSSEMYGNIFVVNKDGSDLTQITDTNKVALTWFKSSLDTHGSTDGAGISPDGKKLTFAQYDDNGIVQIMIANIDGSGLKQITNSDTSCAKPQFSPDGKRISYLKKVGPYYWQLFTMDVTGSNSRQETFLSEGAVNNYQWYPTGDKIYYSYLRWGEGEFNFDNLYTTCTMDIYMCNVEPVNSIFLDDYDSYELGAFEFANYGYTNPRSENGSWQISNDTFAGKVLSIDEVYGGYYTFIPNKKEYDYLKDYDLTAWVMPQHATEQSGLIGRCRNGDMFNMARFVTTGDGKRLQLYRIDNVYKGSQMLADVPFNYNNDQWYKMRMSMYGSMINVYVDDEKLISVVDPAVIQNEDQSLYFGNFGPLAGQKAKFNNLSVASKTNLTVGETWNIDVPESIQNVAYQVTEDTILSVQDGIVTALTPGTTTLTITGDGFSNSFEITVAQIPPKANNATYTIDQNTKLTDQAFPMLNGENLTFSIVEEPVNGIVTISGNTFTYTPNPDFYGKDIFKFMAENEIGSSSGYITMDVREVINTNPVISANAEQGNTEGWEYNSAYYDFAVTEDDAYSGKYSYQATLKNIREVAPAYTALSALEPSKMYIAKTKLKLAQSASALSADSTALYPVDSLKKYYDSVTMTKEDWATATAVFDAQTVTSLQPISWSIPENSAYLIDDLNVYELLAQNIKIKGDTIISNSKDGANNEIIYKLMVTDKIFQEQYAIEGDFAWQIKGDAPAGVSVTEEGKVIIEKDIAQNGSFVLQATIPAGLMGNKEEILAEQSIAIAKELVLYEGAENLIPPQFAYGIFGDSTESARVGITYDEVCEGSASFIGKNAGGDQGISAVTYAAASKMQPDKRYIATVKMKLPKDGVLSTATSARIYSPSSTAAIMEETIHKDTWTSVYTALEQAENSFMQTQVLGSSGSEGYLFDEFQIQEVVIKSVDILGSNIAACVGNSQFSFAYKNQFGVQMGNENGSVVWSLENAPEGVSIDPQTGVLQANDPSLAGKTATIKAYMVNEKISGCSELVAEKEITFGPKPLYYFDAEGDFSQITKNAHIISKTEDAHSGDYALLVQSTSNSPAGGVEFKINTSELVEGRTYVGRAYIKLPNDSLYESSSDFLFYCYNSPLVPINPSAEERTIYRDHWTPVYFSFIYAKSPDVSGGLAPTSIGTYSWNLGNDFRYIIDDVEIFENDILHSELTGPSVISGNSGEYTYQAGNVFNIGYGAGGFNLDVQNVEWEIVSDAKGVSLNAAKAQVGEAVTLNVSDSVPDMTAVTLRAKMETSYFSNEYGTSPNPKISNTEAFAVEKTIIISKQSGVNVESVTNALGEDLFAVGLKDGEITAALQIANLSDEIINPTVIWALYDGEQLVQIETQRASVAVNSLGEIEATIITENVDSGYSLKLMVLDSFDTLQPMLRENISFTVK